jgi:colanic acid biosynthesis glycosyl transferase WcaI
MNQKQGLELLAAAAKALADHDNLWWIFCGEGPTAPLLVQACAGLKQVLFLPLQSMVRFTELLQLADIHLLPQKHGAEDLVMPSKLLAMLASGRPVIATVDPISALGQVVLTPHPAGVVTAPGNLSKLTAAILKLASSPTMRFQLGSQARERVMKYWDKQTVLLRFEQLLLGMGGRSSSQFG